MDKVDHRMNALVNKNEPDLRRTFSEIVSGFPFAKEQKKLIDKLMIREETS